MKTITYRWRSDEGSYTGTRLFRDKTALLTHLNEIGAELLEVVRMVPVAFSEDSVRVIHPAEAMRAELSAEVRHSSIRAGFGLIVIPFLFSLALCFWAPFFFIGAQTTGLEQLQEDTKQLYHSYYPDGSLSEYFEGDADGPHGEYFRFYENGKMKEKGIYANGVRHGLIYHYREDGTLAESSQYEKGLKQGISRLYFPGGVLFSEAYFKENKKEGVARSYWESGRLRSLFTIEAGQLHGVAKVYARNGDIEQIAIFQQGELISLKMFHPDKPLSVRLDDPGPYWRSHAINPVTAPAAKITVISEPSE